MPAGSYKLYLKDGASLLLNTLTTNPLIIEREDGSDIECIIGVEKIPSLENTVIEGGHYDFLTQTVKGEGITKLTLSGIKMRKNKSCSVSITFRGIAKEMSLSSYDVTHSRYMNTSTDVIKELEDGSYKISLELTPSYTRDKNEFVLDAMFDGSFEILDFSIK